MDDPISAKIALRREMRALRMALPDRAVRSDRIWSHVTALPVVREAGTIMVFDSIAGEPDGAPFIEWCRAIGKSTIVPAADPGARSPADVARIDVVIVPGVAFTVAGDRLGQGGGWYDRLLSRVRPDCVTVGVGFAAQILAWLPTEPHDVRLDVVVTESGATITPSGPLTP